jgi:aminoglycoside phosphotransferase (APT) family kinase protein
MPDGERMTVLSQDFDRIRAVAEKFAPQPRAFPSEPDSDVLGRIAASLREAFSDRSSF